MPGDTSRSWQSRGLMEDVGQASCCCCGCCRWSSAGRADLFVHKNQDCGGGAMDLWATRRGIMTLSDQADACVSSSTPTLDSHDRRGPVCASPGISSLFKRRPTRLRACSRARWTFGSTRRGIMTLSDQADACVSSNTPPPSTPTADGDRSALLLAY